MKQIRAGRKIARYSGVIKTQEAYNASPGGYAVAIPRGRSRVPRIIDAASTQSDLGRYANDCRPANRDENECREQRQFLS
jgi:hypothetical protein